MAESRPFAVITGASSGIGRELARQFVTNDFDLLITAEDSELAAAADDLAGPGTDVQAVPATWRRSSGVEELYQAIQAAGRAPGRRWPSTRVSASAATSPRDNELADELRLIGLNVTGAAVHLAERVLPGMIAGRPRGGVLFTSSIAATGARALSRDLRRVQGVACCPSPRRSAMSCGTPA